MKKLFIFLTLVPLFILNISGDGKIIQFSGYHDPDGINDFLMDAVKKNGKIAKLHMIAQSPGKNKVHIIEIGNEAGKEKKSVPGVLVIGNLSGTNAISTEASLFLISALLNDTAKMNGMTWYILPLGNPDAAWRFFKGPLREDTGNGRPVNDDKDEAVDEDAPEDLNGDGLITMMRVRHPEGKFIPVPGEERLMKEADWTKGERGIYKLYTEGWDNDADGLYNEDGPGGVDLSLNFPHLFKHFTKKGGEWPGSEPEVFGIFKFAFSHKDIAMTMNFGETNFCMTPPQGGRKSQVDYSKIKIPERIGKFMGVDTDRTYSMDEIMEIVQKIAPDGFEITESMVASFLGLGAVVNPIKGDLDFYEKIAEGYKEYLKSVKLDAKRLDPPKAKDGSFELWSYYHLGLPSFTMDFWTLPKVEKKKNDDEITAEKLEKMSNEEFIALGTEKIEKFLRSVNAPKNIKAEFLINGVKNGIMTPKKMAEFMKNMKKPEESEGGTPEEKALLAFSDQEMNGEGFIEWKPFKHKELGNVEIGGARPYAGINPPPAMLSGLLEKQVPFIYEIAKKLAKIRIGEVKILPKGAGVYGIKVWVENRGFLPYPTEMGKKNERIANIIVSLEAPGIRILEGDKRSIVKGIGGNGTRLVEWLILSEKPVDVTIKTITDIAGNDQKIVSLGGGK